MRKFLLGLFLAVSACDTELPDEWAVQDEAPWNGCRLGDNHSCEYWYQSGNLVRLASGCEPNSTGVIRYTGNLAGMVTGFLPAHDPTTADPYGDASGCYTYVDCEWAVEGPGSKPYGGPFNIGTAEGRQAADTFCQLLGYDTCQVVTGRWIRGVATPVPSRVAWMCR